MVDLKSGDLICGTINQKTYMLMVLITKITKSICRQRDCPGECSKTSREKKMILYSFSPMYVAIYAIKRDRSREKLARFDYLALTTSKVFLNYTVREK